VFAHVDRHVLRASALLIAALVVGVLIGRPQPTQAPPVTVDPPSSVVERARDLVVVHVSGEVASAGLVEVPADARVADVIAAAGGVTPRADLIGVNLAEPVVDGQQIVVPVSGGERAAASANGTDSRIRINDADAAALETLPGVGPVLAGSIIEHRAEYGPFRTVEDLLDVPGIGEQKLASLRDRVIVP
jgi:competence protein ComEA